MRIASHRIPVAYQELEYLEGTGTQGIQLNITPTSKYKIEEVFELTNTSVNSTFWCARTGSDIYHNTISAFYVYTQSSLRCDYNTSLTYTGNNLTAGTKYTLLMDSENWYLNDTLVTSMSAATFTAGGPLLVFVSNNPGSYANYSRLKLYSFKVWDTQRNLVGDYIPCIRKSDSKIGLYDRVGKGFYYDMNDNTFTTGRALRLDSFVNTSIHSLNYEALEYIESTNSLNNYQYIDTGVRMASAINVDMTLLPTQQNKDERFLGAYDNGIYIGQLSSKWRYGPSCTYNDVAIDYTNPTRITAKTNKWTFNDTNKTVSVLGNNNYKILLFAASYKADTPYGYGACKLYECKLYNNNELIRDFIPAKRKSDNEIGLFDNVEKKFYTNDGTGTFVAGPVASVNRIIEKEIAWFHPVIMQSDYQEIAYLESTGQQYMNTGIPASTTTGFSLKFQGSTGTYTSNKDNMMLGSRNSSKRFWVDFDMSNNKNDNILFGYGNYYHVLDHVAETTDIFTMTSNLDGTTPGRCILYRNDVQAATYDASSDTIAGNTLNMYIFAANDTGNANFLSYVRIYNCKLYQQGTLVRDFIPCIRRIDNVPGLLDIVNNEFYTNQGSGNFILGANVPNAHIPFHIV